MRIITWNDGFCFYWGRRDFRGKAVRQDFESSPLNITPSSVYTKECLGGNALRVLPPKLSSHKTCPNHRTAECCLMQNLGSFLREKQQGEQQEVWGQLSSVGAMPWDMQFSQQEQYQRQAAGGDFSPSMPTSQDSFQKRPPQPQKAGFQMRSLAKTSFHFKHNLLHILPSPYSHK